MRARPSTAVSTAPASDARGQTTGFEFPDRRDRRTCGEKQSRQVIENKKERLKIGQDNPNFGHLTGRKILAKGWAIDSVGHAVEL